jgi:hypothetical protein
MIKNSIVDKELSHVTKSLVDLTDAIGHLVSDPSKIIITNKELCGRLKVCSRTVQKWRDNGLITYSKIGREIFYKYSDVLHMIESHETRSIKQ